MSIAEIKPDDLPVELRVKIEHVMRERNLTWSAAVLSLAREVVSPGSEIRNHGRLPYCP